MATLHHLSDLDGTPHANVFPDAEPKTIRLTLDASTCLVYEFRGVPETRFDYNHWGFCS
jgi:hypothetical protein